MIYLCYNILNFSYSGYGDIDNEGETCADVYFLYYDEILIDRKCKS